MTKPKNKVSLLGLVIAFVFMVAGIFMFVPNNIATVSAQDLDKDIHFDLATSNEKLVFAPGAQTVGAVTITYTVVNTNDGINNLVFIPAYNHDVFAIGEITVNANTNLGDATITNGYSSYTGDYVKLAFDSTTLFDAEDVTLVTITYNTKENLTYLNNGTYNFSLLLNYTDLSQTRSTAYYILGDENLGEQEEVEIIVDDVNVELYIQRQGQLELVTTQVVYDANEVGISLNGENEVTYSYTGSNEVTWTWYDEENGTVISTPKNAGTYYLTGVMAANNVYSGASTAHAVVVTKKTATVVIDNKESVYGDALLALTRQAPTGLLGNDTLSITLSTTAQQGSPVGHYAITGTVGTGSNPNYDVTFTNGTYTITARAITITADSKTLKYGENPVELTPTVVNGINNDEIGVSFKVYKNYGEETQEEIELSNETNVGVYTIVPSATNTNYTYTYNNGTYTVESVGKTADYIKSFFSGATVEYDATSHNLLVLRNKNDNEEVRPNWINSNTYTVTSANNNQTNVSTSNNGKYIISVAVTLDAQDAANYTNGDTQFNFTVEGEITPKAITVKAADKSHFYGEDPVELTPTTAGLNNEIAISFKVYDLNDDEIELSKTTNVDLYDIVPQVGEYSNYTITTENGTYEVKKATAVVTVNANDVIYNRALDYTVTATVNGVTITPAITISKEVGGDIVYQNGEFVNGSVLDAGIYRVTAVAAETDNYYADSEYKSFAISKIDLATPTVTYENGTATWTVVSNDAGAENVNAKALVNGTTVTYAINNVAVDGTSYTASSKDALTLTVSSSNANYNSVSVNLATLFAVTFNEGTHPATQDNAQNMPETQYIFNGAKAVAPATNPTLTGYTFEKWDFNFDTAITEDTTVVALWTIGQKTMTVVYVHSANNTYVETSKTFNVNYNSNVVINTSNFIEKANITDIVSQYDLNGMRYKFNGFWNYKITGEDEYIRENVTDIVVNATENYTFVALYNATPIDYKLTYMLSIDGGEYAQYGEKVTVAYNSEMNYATLSNVQWFRNETWFADANRTTSAPVKMPANNLTVYGARVFNIGKGDVNGDGVVTTADITLYRQWIVGGYTMKVVENGNEYATATSEQFNAQNVYYLKRVADINVDLSKDIRDVSITRMSIAGGYKWDIVTGENVTGQEIIRNVYSANIDTIKAAIQNGGRATVYADITDTTKEIEIVKPESIYIDLNGHTIYIKSFDVRTTGVGSTITVLNGTIKTTDGITIAAPNGNVILQDLEGWVNDNQVNLQAASNSLHIKQNVAFYNYAYEQQANQQEQVLTLTPATVNVAKDTHVHVEEEADLVVEKLVVTEENFTAIEEIAEATISIKVDSEVTNVIKVEGTCDVEVAEEIEEVKVVTPEDEAYATITTETRRYVTTEQELKDALVVGGEILIGANINLENRVNINNDVNIDLKGKTITGTLSVFDGNVTLNNGKIVGEVDAYDGAVLTLGANLVVENNKVDGFAVVVWGDENNNLNPVLNVYGTVRATNTNAAAISGNGTDLSNATCVVYDGAIVSSANDIAIYWPNAGTLTVKEGATVTGATAIYVKSGTVNIEEDANITSNLTEKVAYNFNGNGAYATGDAIVIDNCDYPGGSAVVTIAGNYDIGRYYYIRTAEQLAHVAQVGGKAQLAANINIDSYIVVRKNLVLDLNNKTISGCIVVYNCEATLDNGKIVGEVDDYYGAVLTLGANLVVENNAEDGFAVVVWGNANNNLNPVLNVYGTVRATNTNAVAISGNGTDLSNATCVVYDGAIVSSANDIAIYWPNAGTLTIKEGATVTGATAVYVKSGVLNVEANANITSNLTEKVQYRYNGNGAYATGDAIVIDNCDYPGGNAVVTIEGEYDVETYWYVKTEQQLNNAVSNGKNIQLGADINLATTVVVLGNVTLDLNGHKLYNTTDIWGAVNWSLISVRGGNLTINGDGLLDAKENDCYAIDVQNGAELVVNGGTYYGNISAIYAHSGNVTVNDGEFHLKQVMTDGGDACRYMLNCLDASYKNGISNFVVTGGKFHNFNPAGSIGENPTANYVAEGYKSVYIEDEQLYWVVDKDAIIGSGASMIVSEEEEF